MIFYKEILLKQIKIELNWKPKTNLEQLVKSMVKSDMEKIKNRGYLINKKSKIFVAGHNGLVGSSIVNCLKKMDMKIL